MEKLKSCSTSVFLTLAGGAVGFFFFMRLGYQIDKAIISNAGLSPHYHYWSLRFAIAGIFIGWVAGAIGGHFLDRSKRNL